MLGCLIKKVKCEVSRFLRRCGLFGFDSLGSFASLRKAKLQKGSASSLSFFCQQGQFHKVETFVCSESKSPRVI